MLLYLIVLPNSSNSSCEKANLPDAGFTVGTFCVGLEKSSDRLPNYLVFAQTLIQAMFNERGRF